MKMKIMLAAILALIAGVKVAQAEYQVMIDPVYVKSSTAGSTASSLTAPYQQPGPNGKLLKGWALGVVFSTGACGDKIELRDDPAAISTGPLIAVAFNVNGSTALAPSTDPGKVGCVGMVPFPAPVPFYSGLAVVGPAGYQNGSLRVLWYRKP